jgi:hypothetical protein
MKPETIEQFVVYRFGGVMCCYALKEEAENDVKHHGGTVVRLTGELPKTPIKYSVELWGNEWKPDKFGDTTFSQQVHGIAGLWATEKVTRCPIKYRITVEEILE